MATVAIGTVLFSFIVFYVAYTLAVWCAPKLFPPGFSALVRATWDWLQSDTATRRILALGDPLYPGILLQIEDPPPLLYAMGMEQAWSDNLLNTSTCLAVVGSRNRAGPAACLR
jgi:hypothetical protein